MTGATREASSPLHVAMPWLIPWPRPCTPRRGSETVKEDPCPLSVLAPQEGVEPPTSWFVAMRSIQLSYWGSE